MNRSYHETHAAINEVGKEANERSVTWTKQAGILIREGDEKSEKGRPTQF